MVDAKIKCDTVPELDYILVERESPEYLTYISVINERGKDEPGDDRGTQRAQVHLNRDSVRELVHALGGVTRDDLEVWMESNSGDQMLMRSFINESGYFPKGRPCEHQDIRLDGRMWTPAYEALHGECDHCGAEMRYELGNDEWEVEE